MKNYDLIMCVLLYAFITTFYICIDNYLKCWGGEYAK